MTEKKEIPLKKSEILYLIGESGTVGILKVGKEKILFIGTPEMEEIAQFLEEDDLIAISAFGLGKKFEKGIKSLGYITREMDAPIVVLPKNHPSSKRLSMVLSVGDKVKLNCNIIPGTHPEQNVLCSCDSLSGLTIEKSKNGVIIDGRLKNYKIEEF